MYKRKLLKALDDLAFLLPHWRPSRLQAALFSPGRHGFYGDEELLG